MAGRPAKEREKNENSMFRMMQITCTTTQGDCSLNLQTWCSYAPRESGGDRSLVFSVVVVVRIDFRVCVCVAILLLSSSSSSLN